MKIHKDLKEFIELLNSNGVEYLVVGAFAVIFAIRKTPEVRNLTRLDF